MDVEGIWDHSPIYSVLFGVPVLLFVIRECRVPIPCNIIAESVFTVRIRLQLEWEIDVPNNLFQLLKKLLPVGKAI
jgi:hypothetical protein